MPNSQPIQQFRSNKNSDNLVNDILEEIENANDNNEQELINQKQKELLEQQNQLLIQKQQQEEELLQQKKQHEEMLLQQQREQEQILQQQQETMRQEQEALLKKQEENLNNQPQDTVKNNEINLDALLQEDFTKSKDVPAESFKVNLNKNEDTTTSVLEKCLKTLKSSVIVGIIILVMLLPVTDRIFGNVLPNKEFIQNNLTIITNVIKSLVGAVIFYLVDFFS